MVAPVSKPNVGRVDVHLREMNQLIETLDPSPFRERDLDRRAEEYIVESVREMPSGMACELVIHLDQSAGHPDEERILGDAIRSHFARQSRYLRRDLERRFRRGLLSLVVGLAFLGAIFITVQVTGLASAESGFATIVRESMMIVGWVAMWRPLDLFLYEWWPIVGERRLNDRLSRIQVRIVRGNGASP
jgi:hypothetical protein